MAAGSANGREQSRENRHHHGRASCLVPDFQSALGWRGLYLYLVIDARSGKAVTSTDSCAGKMQIAQNQMARSTIVTIDLVFMNKTYENQLQADVSELKHESYEYQEILLDGYSAWLSDRSREYLDYRKLWHDIQNGSFELAASFPLHLDIEATTRCNLKCTMCPRTEIVAEGGYWKLEDFDFNDYTRIVDDFVSLGGKSIKYNFLGEPLLNKRLPDMIAYASDLGLVDIAINTNLTVLTPYISEQIIKAGLTRLLVSFDAADKDTYEAIRVNASFDTVISNLAMFRQIRDKLITTSPLIRVGCTWQAKNALQKEEYIQLFSPVADVIGMGTVDEYKPLSHELLTKYKETLRPKGYKFVCHQLYQRLFFHPDGTTTMCCNDVKREINIGNFHACDQPVKEMWSSDTLVSIREKHQEGNFYDILPCSRCNMPRLAIENQLRSLL